MTFLTSYFTLWLAKRRCNVARRLSDAAKYDDWTDSLRRGKR